MLGTALLIVYTVTLTIHRV